MTTRCPQAPSGGRGLPALGCKSVFKGIFQGYGSKTFSGIWGLLSPKPNLGLAVSQAGRRSGETQFPTHEASKTRAKTEKL